MVFLSLAFLTYASPVRQRKKYDAIVSLGGGQTRDGGVPEHVLRRYVPKSPAKYTATFSRYCCLCGRQLCTCRLKLAAEKHFSTGSRIPIVVLSAGTTHKPNPRDVRGFPVKECTSEAFALKKLGVASDHIYQESVSLDTIGNAYFLRTIHTDPVRWRRLLVITSEFHMNRTRAIFDWVRTVHPVSARLFALSIIVTSHVYTQFYMISNLETNLRRFSASVLHAWKHRRPTS